MNLEADTHHIEENYWRSSSSERNGPGVVDIYYTTKALNAFGMQENHKITSRIHGRDSKEIVCINW